MIANPEELLQERAAWLCQMAGAHEAARADIGSDLSQHDTAYARDPLFATGLLAKLAVQAGSAMIAAQRHNHARLRFLKAYEAYDQEFWDTPAPGFAFLSKEDADFIAGLVINEDFAACKFYEKNLGDKS